MILFDGWWPIVRTLISGTLAYVTIILILRLFGKRTLSKWNAFDYVVTIALGSVLGALVVSKTTSLAQGGTALLLLVALQFVVTWLSVRARWVSELVKAKPALLLFRGEFQQSTMRAARVTEGEIRTALRNQGIGRMDEAAAVVLETDGSFSVIPELDEGGRSTLFDVEGFEEKKRAPADRGPQS